MAQGKSKRGLGSPKMDPVRKRQIQSMGGKARGANRDDTL